jgi:DNA polymerase-3 subunit delta'
MIFGYDELVNDFKRLADQRLLSHAYLFFGERELGKFLFAKSLANYLENQKFEEPEKTLIETIVVDLEEIEKDSDESRESLGIEKVREVERFLYQTPISSAYRVAIIRDAEWLTDQAQNALLKILEEPPKTGLIIAIAKDQSVFLPTVSSRFLNVFFPSLPDSSILDFLNKYGIIEQSKVKSIVLRSLGRLGRATRIAKGDKDREKALEIAKEVLKTKLNPYNLNDLTEKIIVFGEKNPKNIESLLEELILILSEDKVKNLEALKEICNFFVNFNLLTINKRIHIKKLLCQITSYS